MNPKAQLYRYHGLAMAAPGIMASKSDSPKPSVLAVINSRPITSSTTDSKDAKRAMPSPRTSVTGPSSSSSRARSSPLVAEISRSSVMFSMHSASLPMSVSQKTRSCGFHVFVALRKTPLWLVTRNRSPISLTRAASVDVISAAPEITLVWAAEGAESPSTSVLVIFSTDLIDPRWTWSFWVSSPNFRLSSSKLQNTPGIAGSMADRFMDCCAPSVFCIIETDVGEEALDVVSAPWATMLRSEATRDNNSPRSQRLLKSDRRTSSCELRTYTKHEFTNMARHATSPLLSRLMNKPLHNHVRPCEGRTNMPNTNNTDTNTCDTWDSATSTVELAVPRDHMRGTPTNTWMIITVM